MEHSWDRESAGSGGQCGSCASFSAINGVGSKLIPHAKRLLRPAMVAPQRRKQKGCIRADGQGGWSPAGGSRRDQRSDLLGELFDLLGLVHDVEREHFLRVVFVEGFLQLRDDIGEARNVLLDLFLVGL